MIIYYTHNRLDERIASVVRENLKATGLPIVSCSLQPIDFGKNIVLEKEPSAVTMVEQIIACLMASTSKYVFFCEHDVLYHQSHFEFKPERDDIFYYNTNVWKWDMDTDRCITHDHLRSLSGLCVNRLKALEHFSKRLEYIKTHGFDKLPITRNPDWARKYGYEPSEKNGEKTEEWRSTEPNIDIRYGGNMTPRKMRLSQYINKPTGWKEDVITNLWKRPLPRLSTN